MAATLYTARLIGPEVIEAGMDNVVTSPGVPGRRARCPDRLHADDLERGERSGGVADGERGEQRGDGDDHDGDAVGTEQR